MSPYISAYRVILQAVQNGVESKVQGGENLLELKNKYIDFVHNKRFI